MRRKCRVEEITTDVSKINKKHHHTDPRSAENDPKQDRYE